MKLELGLTILFLRYFPGEYSSLTYFNLLLATLFKYYDITKLHIILRKQNDIY
jgi:hypothetical protein